MKTKTSEITDNSNDNPRIEKSIPIPLKGTRRAKFPFMEMEVGDSFIAGGYTRSKLSSVISCGRSQAYRHKKLWEFVAHVTKDNMIRVWRTK